MRAGEGLSASGVAGLGVATTAITGTGLASAAYRATGSSTTITGAGAAGASALDSTFIALRASTDMEDGARAMTINMIRMVAAIRMITVMPETLAFATSRPTK